VVLRHVPVQSSSARAKPQTRGKLETKPQGAGRSPAYALNGFASRVRASDPPDPPIAATIGPLHTRTPPSDDASPQGCEKNGRPSGRRAFGRVHTVAHQQAMMNAATALLNPMSLEECYPGHLLAISRNSVSISLEWDRASGAMMRAVDLFQSTGWGTHGGIMGCRKARKSSRQNLRFGASRGFWRSRRSPPRSASPQDPRSHADPAGAFRHGVQRDDSNDARAGGNSQPGRQEMGV